MGSIDYRTTLATLRAQQSAQPLSILSLAEPITASQSQSRPHAQDEHQLRASDVSTSASQNASEADSSLLTPASLSADLTHYKDLFSKLRFSYLEQVTKEKYLRSIVGDPPLVVSHDDNLALEAQLGTMKGELQGKKAQVDALVAEMEAQARALAQSQGSVARGMLVLETLPVELARLAGEIEALQAEMASRRADDGDTGADEQRQMDPRMNMSLEETERALAEQRDRTADVDAQIEQLLRQMPAKVRQAEKVDRELVELEKRRNESARLAVELRRRREMGGRDQVEEMGRWYKSSDAVLRGLLGVEG